MKTLTIIFLLPFLSFSQENWVKVDAALFMQTIREYEQSLPVGENYALETGYRVYNNYADQKPVQSFNGRLICKAGKELNIYQMSHLMIQDPALNITIDTSSKQILLQKPDPTFFYRKTVQDYAIFLEMAETVYKKVANGKTAYLLELKADYPYKSMEFIFSDKNFISQIIIYSNQPYYNEGETFSNDKAKIVLDFSEFKKGKAVDFTRFLTVKDCILIKGKEITPTAQYKDFEIIDLRN